MNFSPQTVSISLSTPVQLNIWVRHSVITEVSVDLTGIALGHIMV